MQEPNFNCPKWVRDGMAVRYRFRDRNDWLVTLGPFFVGERKPDGSVELYTGPLHAIGTDRIHAIVGARVLTVGEDRPIDLSRLIPA